MRLKKKWDDFLDHTRYRQLPYYPMIMAGLLSFLDYDALALRFLAKSEPDIRFHEYQLPWLYYKIMYLRNEPVIRYKYLLEEIQKTVRERLETVGRVENRCHSDAKSCGSQLRHWEESAAKVKKHAQRAQQLAVNNIAYGIAQDIAAGIDGAQYLEPLAVELTINLGRLVKDWPNSETTGAFSNRTERESARDTVAFVQLVVEARKPTPNPEKIKAAIAALEQVVSTQLSAVDEQTVHNKKVDESDRNLLSLARAHLSAARALIDE